MTAFLAYVGYKYAFFNSESTKFPFPIPKELFNTIILIDKYFISGTLHKQIIKKS